MKRLTATAARRNLNSAALDKFAARMNKELDVDRKAGKLKPFTGKLKGR